MKYILSLLLALVLVIPGMVQANASSMALADVQLELDMSFIQTAQVNIPVSGGSPDPNRDGSIDQYWPRIIIGPTVREPVYIASGGQILAVAYVDEKLWPRNPLDHYD